VRRTYVRRSDFEMQRNAEIGLFAEPSFFNFSGIEDKQAFKYDKESVKHYY
jgi:hypothetical protein